MKAKEFSRGLIELANRHKNDEVNIFGTNWYEICMETAEFIQNLDNELKDRDEKIAEFKAWYDANEKAILKALNQPKDVSIPDFVLKEDDKPQIHSTGSNWDGVRRDYEDGFTPVMPEEDPFDDSIRPLFPLKD